jgi:hypothetical protein
VKTHLYDEHLKLKAKIVDFHGWDMPIQYTNIIEEHTAVRQKVGLFDLSHMGRIWVRGKDRQAWLNRVLTIDIPKMAPRPLPLHVPPQREARSSTICSSTRTPTTTSRSSSSRLEPREQPRVDESRSDPRK